MIIAGKIIHNWKGNAKQKDEAMIVTCYHPCLVPHLSGVVPSQHPYSHSNSHYNQDNRIPSMQQRGTGLTGAQKHLQVNHKVESKICSGLCLFHLLDTGVPQPST